MTRPQKSVQELEIFRSFARVSPQEIDISSIENRTPPEPDIRCSTVLGEVAFELTELIDRAHMERVAMVFNTKTALHNFYEKELSPERRVQFDQLYDRALIHFDFAENTKMADRKAVFRAAFDVLLSCRSSLAEFTVKHDPSLMPVLVKIRVKKSLINGPIFDVAAFGWLADPTEEAISKKLKKPYECDCPLELLAYIDWNLLPPEGAWKPAAERAAMGIAGTQFRRVWVYGVKDEKIQFVYPEP